MNDGTSKMYETRAKDVLPNIHRTQAAESSCHHALLSPPDGDGMVPSAAAHHLQCTVHTLQCTVNGDDAAVFPALSLVTLTFDLDIHTPLSEGPNTSSL